MHGSLLSVINGVSWSKFLPDKIFSMAFYNNHAFFFKV